MSDTTKKIKCDKHGESHITFVCQHLARGSKLGFFYGNQDDLRPDAWCGDCDHVLEENDWEWNDESEAYAGITIICANCYDTVRKRNEVPFKRYRPKSRPNLEEDGWELGDVIRQHSLHPETFQIPSEQELRSLRMGDWAKLLFKFAIQDKSDEFEVRDERMWVVIERVKGTEYIGRLDSTPSLSNKVKPFDKIRFQRNHILLSLRPSLLVRITTPVKQRFAKLIGSKRRSQYDLVSSTHHKKPPNKSL